MKACVLYANRDLRYTDWEEPVCGPDQVKIHVRATGICGSDVPRVLHNGAHFYPIVLGHEFSGDVVETGEGVTNCAPGDTVTAAPLPMTVATAGSSHAQLYMTELSPPVTMASTGTVSP